ncbi:hypothetical protein NKH48_35820, partial [Mesorhizobium sp. M1233]|uniref:hypothetical protein n=1 Tax=Mesorhizobium sp. M1233 TaxID=2957072 RepID=UPI00333C890A
MTQPGSEQTASPEWQAFISKPASYVDAAWLAECFDGAVGEAACAPMKHTQRVEERPVWFKTLTHPSPYYLLNSVVDRTIKKK